MNIKIIISMFEDLKKLISEQFSKLSKLVEPLANAKSDLPVLPIIPQIDLSELENHAVQTNKLIKEGFQKQQERLHEFEQKLEKLQDKPLPVQKHLHTIELKSSKVVIALVSLSTTLLSSVCYIVYQFSANNRLSNNDIKFHYIKAFGEITPENLLKLETIFKYKPDKQKQHSIRRMVEEYEHRVEQRARELEEAHLKEAESIKQKR